jgi:hypothetical protein
VSGGVEGQRNLEGREATGALQVLSIEGSQCVQCVTVPHAVTFGKVSAFFVELILEIL